jgi:2-isopropylmalate synthase
MLRTFNFPRIHTVGTSDSHIIHKLNTTRDDIIARAKYAVLMQSHMLKMSNFMLKMPDVLTMILSSRSVRVSGATVLNIPDTTGYCLPDEYGQKLNMGECKR